jgi:hypothetical protein
MTRALSLAAVLVAGLSLPAIADNTATNAGPQAAATNSAAIGSPFTMEDARQHLMQLGYTNVSALVKDANGKWVGSATKDGRRIAVAVGVKGLRAN